MCREADEITHRLVCLIRHPDRGQFTGLSSLASCNAPRRFDFTRAPGLRWSVMARPRCTAETDQLAVEPNAATRELERSGTLRFYFRSAVYICSREVTRQTTAYSAQFAAEPS